MSKSAVFQLKSWLRFLLPSRYVAPYHATPEPVVRRMLQLAKVSAADTVYDIGCGDARLLIAAARLGAKGVGFELHSELVLEAKQEVERAGYSGLVKVVQQDAARASVWEATVITLYLSDSGNTRMVNSLKHDMRSGAALILVQMFKLEGSHLGAKVLIPASEEGMLPSVASHSNIDMSTVFAFCPATAEAAGRLRGAAHGSDMVKPAIATLQNVPSLR